VVAPILSTTYADCLLASGFASSRLSPRFDPVASSSRPETLPDVGLARDVVAVEHRARLVPGDLHRHHVGDAGADQVPDRAPSQIVGLSPRQPCGPHAAFQAPRRFLMRFPLRWPTLT